MACDSPADAGPLPLPRNPNAPLPL